MTTTFESLPGGGTTTVKSGQYGPFNQTKREAKTRWVLNPADEGVPQVVVDLTTSHYGDRKQFSTSLTWAKVEPAVPGSAFHVETWGSDHTMIRVRTAPCPRYSQKAMEAHHALALETLEEHFAGAFAPVFDEAAERTGLTNQTTQEA